MSTVPLRARYIPHVSRLGAAARVVAVIVAVLDVFTEAQGT